MTRVLFSTPCQPYPTQFANDSLTDFSAQRLCKGQDIFTLSGHFHCYGAHLLAQNILAPSVFLEYPHREDFEAEVRKGYDFVGISFFAPSMETVLEMCQAVRRLSPRSQVILGGYGAMAFDAAFSEEFKRQHADHVCVGDGIHLMRRLLGEPLDAPITQSHLPRGGSNLPWLDRHPRGNCGFIVAGLGCPSGCDFCATTQMHGNARIQLFPPAEIFREIQRIYREYPDTQQIMVYDEDYLKYPDEVRELGRLIQEDTEFGLRKINWFALSSIESINQYDFDELALAGWGSTFIGVESKFAPDRGYQKRSGRDAKETIDELQKRGIACIGGLMCGFDFHDRVNLEEDFNYFISLGLIGKQITRVSPFPGTPLWERLKEEGRLLDVPWTDQNFYGGGYQYKNFEPHELEQFILEGYERYYQTWGPSLMRQLRVSLNGYEYARSKGPHRLWDQLAERHRESSQLVRPMIRACEQFAPNGIVRRKILQYEDRCQRNFGPLSRSQTIQSYYVLAKSFQAWIHEEVDPSNRHPKKEPFKKYIYPKQGHGGDSPPYRVVYPRQDREYERYSQVRDLKEGLFGKVLGWLDRAGAPTETVEGGANLKRLKAF